MKSILLHLLNVLLNIFKNTDMWSKHKALFQGHISDYILYKSSSFSLRSTALLFTSSEFFSAPALATVFHTNHTHNKQCVCAQHTQTLVCSPETCPLLWPLSRGKAGCLPSSLFPRSLLHTFSFSSISFFFWFYLYLSIYWSIYFSNLLLSPLLCCMSLLLSLPLISSSSFNAVHSSPLIFFPSCFIFCPPLLLSWCFFSGCWCCCGALPGAPCPAHVASIWAQRPERVG